MIKKSRAREQALQVLYFIDMTGLSREQALELFKAHFETKDADVEFMDRLIEGVVDHRNDLDAVIQAHLHEWKISRLPRVDRNILRIGTYEMKFTRDVPGAVILDEAVELAKKYGDTKSSAFINGTLDQIARNERGAAL